MTSFLFDPSVGYDRAHRPVVHDARAAHRRAARLGGRLRRRRHRRALAEGRALARARRAASSRSTSAAPTRSPSSARSRRSRSSPDGTIFATSPRGGRAAHRCAATPPTRQRASFPQLGEPPARRRRRARGRLDVEADAVIVDGRAIELPEPALRLQQSGADHDRRYVATGDRPARGAARRRRDPRRSSADAAVAAATADEVARPCGSTAARTAPGRRPVATSRACDGDEARVAVDIEQPTAGSRLEFRVNRDVIALNNLSNGNVWLVDSNMRLVDNWEEVTPPEESDERGGRREVVRSRPSRTRSPSAPTTNRPPIARDDDVRRASGPHDDPRGARERHRPRRRRAHRRRTDRGRRRPGPARAHRRRACPAVHPGSRVPPARCRSATRSTTAAAGSPRQHVERAHRARRARTRAPIVAPRRRDQRRAGPAARATTCSSDWIDPDGDDVFLVNASPTSGDSVRFSPDGFVTFEHQTRPSSA